MSLDVLDSGFRQGSSRPARHSHTASQPGILPLGEQGGETMKVGACHSDPMPVESGRGDRKRKWPRLTLSKKTHLSDSDRCGFELDI